MRKPVSCMTEFDRAFAVAWFHTPPWLQTQAPNFEDVQNMAAAKVQRDALAAKATFKPAGQTGKARLDVLSWTLAGAIAVGLSCAHLLDGPTELQAVKAVASNAHQAQREAQHQARFVKAARRACGGDSAAYLLLADNSIQCGPAGSFRTLKVAL